MGLTTAIHNPLEEFPFPLGDGVQHEVSAGELIAAPPAKFSHVKISLAILEALQAYLRDRDWKAIPEASYVLSPEPLTIRQPDVSVLSGKRFQATKDSYCEGAPELAIEVVSPGDSAEDLELKITQYLDAGALEVWVLYPKTTHIHVFRADWTGTVLNATQTLDGGAVLPGFSVTVRDLFAV